MVASWPSAASWPTATSASAAATGAAPSGWPSSSRPGRGLLGPARPPRARPGGQLVPLRQGAGIAVLVAALSGSSISPSSPTSAASAPGRSSPGPACSKAGRATRWWAATSSSAWPGARCSPSSASAPARSSCGWGARSRRPSRRDRRAPLDAPAPELRRRPPRERDPRRPGPPAALPGPPARDPSGPARRGPRRGVPGLRRPGRLEGERLAHAALRGRGLGRLRRGDAALRRPGRDHRRLHRRPALLPAAPLRARELDGRGHARGPPAARRSWRCWPSARRSGALGAPPLPRPGRALLRPARARPPPHGTFSAAATYSPYRAPSVHVRLPQLCHPRRPVRPVLPGLRVRLDIAESPTGTAPRSGAPLSPTPSPGLERTPRAAPVARSASGSCPAPSWRDATASPGFSAAGGWARSTAPTT